MQVQSERLGKEKISQLLIKLSIPAIIGFLVTAFYNVVDAIFIGRWVGTLALAGVSIGFPVMMILMAVAGALGMGGASVISRRLGAGEREKANHTLGNVLSMILLLSVLGVIGALVFVDPILIAFGSTEKILPFARDYLEIILYGFIFFALGMAGNNIIRSEGNATRPMYSMIASAILNIILDAVFILILDMGIKGAAYATVISQACGTIYLVQYFFSGKSTLNIWPRFLMPNVYILKDILAIGAAPFVRQASGSIMFIAVNNMLALYGGDTALAVFGVVNRLMMIFMMPAMGVVQGMQPIVGFNYGARKMQRVEETIKTSTLYATVLSVLAFIVLMVFPGPLVSMFSTDKILISDGIVAMRYMFAVVFLIGFQMVAGGVYQALGKAKPALLLTMIRQILILIPLVLTFPRFWGLTGVWLAFPVSDLLAFIATYLVFMRDKRKGLFTNPPGRGKNKEQAEDEKRAS